MCSKNKIKILYINHATNMSGATISLLRLIKDLNKEKFDVKILFFKKPEYLNYLDNNNIKYEVSNSKFYNKYYTYFTHSEANYTKFFQIFKFVKLTLLWILSRYYFSKKELGKYDYDIVHVNSSVLTDWLASGKRRGKVIMHIREPFRKGKMDVLHYIFRYQIKKYANHVIAISIDNLKRINIAKSTVIYNYSDVPKKTDIEPIINTKNVLYLGGFKKIKGFYTVVDSLDYLDDDVIMQIAGDISSLKKTEKNYIKKYLKKLIFYDRRKNKAYKKLTNHKNVLLLGFIKDVNFYIKNSCCLISPFSVPHFSRPVIEAHLNKRPVIGTNVEGMDEIIENCKNGIIIPKNNPKKLAEAINLLTSDKSKAIQYGLNGYHSANIKYTKNNVNKITDIYLNLCSKK